MQVLDQELETNPTEQAVKDMAEGRIRNLCCFEELQSFNDNGKWLYQHPLIVHRSERSRLEALKRSNPQEFLRQFNNCAQNVRRYKSLVNTSDTEDKRLRYKELLKKHNERKTLFESILNYE